ncbi:DUF488 domain-containing protein [Bifidobacterium choloepi]|uniref:DUF488 domain-containing protein n=1 Tax=Bifidobacterium choloepi TaxID=2614131 RepID=UPI002F2B30E0
MRIKRIYEEPAADDGARILVDRLWPRGVSREKAQLTDWSDYEVPPTAELRKWFGHDPAKFAEFRKRYVAELDASGDAHDFADKVGKTLRDENVTLLYAAKDTVHNGAVVLRDWLDGQLGIATK